jgi:hypothetical protein
MQTNPGFWLLALLTWNLVWTPFLPEVFATPVPRELEYAEWFLRAIIFGGAFTLRVHNDEAFGRKLFLVGAALYLLSWFPILLIAPPLPAVVVLAPFVMPGVWLLGLAIITRSRWYAVSAGFFICTHVAHGLLLV